ncbi:PAS domain S-box protein [Spirulina sp. CS-785/01]|uniref:sensor histidine kinase n=1 Tax=Spirulina sp. CS-785/01 TaxID=3021716 RepID=UPI002330E72B|nr:ATP-binding protein [Spirulina sp. CS-785/01]MDB9312319.1 PAS domain S-box protein [Spirulina sp. CS-785/01]
MKQHQFWQTLILSSHWWGSLLLVILVFSLLTLQGYWFVPIIDFAVAILLGMLLYQLRQELVAKNQRLRETNARLDLANDMILVRDLKDRITYWNPACQRVYGWTASEAIGQSVHQLLQTEFPEPLDVIQSNFLRQGEWRGELVHHTKTGEKITVASTWSLHRNEKGQATANLEINKDITAAKAAEVALRHSEKLYRTLAENFPNGAVFLFDWDYRYTVAEGSELQGMGFSLPLQGKPIDQVWSQTELLVLDPLYRNALMGKNTVTEMQRGNSVYRVYALPVKDEEGNVFAGMAMMQNITESKQAEEKLRSRADQLSTTTHSLAETTAILEKRNQELDQFAYIVSHDLKAPLRAIANLSTWIEEDLEDTLTDDTQHQMNLLRSRVKRMEALIDGLLQYSRVGRFKRQAESVNVEQLLHEVIDSLAPPPEIQIKLASELPILQTERLPLFQVFANLISNAIKHRHSPQGEVTIEAVNQGDFYQFTVADDGYGIDPAYHEKIFVMFQTLEPRDKVENTGVGLAIVKKIIEDQQGSIWVESQEGNGAKFSFTWAKES